MLHVGVVIVGHRPFREGHLEEIEVPGPPQVPIIHRQFLIDTTRGDNDHPVHLFGSQHRCADHRSGTPVVADKVGLPTAKGVDQSDCIASKGD